MSGQTSERPHVLILGAGLGGLALAQALRKHGISYEVFERVEGLRSRFEGWCISLHEILQGLRKDMPDDLPPLENTNHLLPLEAESGMTLYLEHGKKIDVGHGHYPWLRVNRVLLREYLATNANIHWGKRMRQIEESDSSVTLHFEDGSSSTGDILVGANGINSEVRKYIFKGTDKLETLPLTQVIGEVTINREQLDRQFKLGTSAYVVRNHDFRLFVGIRRISEDASQAECYWLWAQLKRDNEHDTLWPLSATKQEQHDYVMSCASGLAPEFAEILHLTKPEGIHSPPLVLRDTIVEAMPNSRVTLLGDAIHPMTPYRGEGGNQAMKDGIYLSRKLADATSTSVKDSLHEYQLEMLARGSAAVKRSRAALSNEMSFTS